MRPNSHPLVSVIIPCYNHEGFIIDCLESVKKDSYDRIEIVFLDDGSSDDSYHIASSWLKANEEFFEAVSYSKQSNQGICKTFNTLVRKSNGEFIFILASDDLAGPDGIYKTVNYYMKYCIEPTLLFTDLELINYQGKLFAESGTAYTHRDAELLELNKRYLKLDALINWGIPYMQQFYPRVLFDLHGGYSEKLKCEDYYFALKNIAADSVAYAPVISRQYRLREDSRSITPGLSEEDYRSSWARDSVAQEFSFYYRALLWILNRRDAGIGASKRSITSLMCHILLRIFMKIARLYYKLS